MLKNILHRRGDIVSRLHATALKGIPMLFTMMALCHAKAQTTESDFTFNEGVRYSKWVIDSRMNSFNANTTQVGFAVYDEDGNKTTERKDGKTTLDYVPGLVAKGIIEASQYYSQYDWAQAWAKPWFMSIQNYGDYFYNKYKSQGGSLDDLNAAKLYIPLRELSATGGKYENKSTFDKTTIALDYAATGLSNHNTTYSIKSGTEAEGEGYDVIGGWWHKSEYNNQMWLDGQYMGGVLLAQLANYKKEKDENVIDATDWDIAVKQLDIVWNMCWNETDKLMYHAFDANAGTGSNSHSETWAGLSGKEGIAKYQSSTYWARACGWYFLALVDMLEEMDKAGIAHTDKKYTDIKSHLDNLAAGLKRWQDKTTGGWYQILDENGTFSASIYNNGKSHNETSNYLESSATAIFAAAYLKALRLGYLDKGTYEKTAKDAYQCLVNRFFAADGKEGVHLFGSCRSAGLGNSGTNAVAGKEKYRNGSKEYYLLGSDVGRVAKDEHITGGKVLGAFILAATEYERTYQKDNEILFEKDLAPSYDLTAGTTDISIKASGSGTAAYQWYNEDGTAVENNESAQSSTFTPTLSGKYYCVATSGSTSIKSSVTEITVNEPEDPEKDKILGETEKETITTGGSNSIVWTFTSKPEGLGTEGNIVTFTSTDGTATEMTYYSGSGDDISKSSNTINNIEYTHYLKINGKADSKGKRWMTFKAPTAKGTITIVYAGTVSTNNTIIYDNTQGKELATIKPATNTAVTSSEISTTPGNEINIYDTKEKNYIYSVIWTPIGESGSGSTYTKYTYRIAENYKTPTLNNTRSIKNGDNTLVTMKFGGWKHNDGSYTTNDGNVTDAWQPAAESGKSVDGFSVCFTGVNVAKDEKKGNFTEGQPFTLPVRGAFMTMEPTQNGKLTAYVMHTGDFYVTDQRGTVVKSATTGTSDITKYEFNVNAGEAYYLFSNTSNMSFCGASFIPDEAQPSGSVTFFDTEKYTSAENADGYEKVTINRTLTANQWNTLTFPFNMTETEVETIFGQGTQIIILDKTEMAGSTANLTFIYHEIQNIIAGYPYFIKPAKGVTNISVEGKHIDISTAQTDIDCGSYTAKGTPGYSTADVESASGTKGYSINYKVGDIFLSDGNGKLYVSQGKSYGKGYRSYIEKKNDGTAAAKSISMEFAGVEDGEQSSTTAIECAKIADGILQTTKAKGVYNLYGQKVADNTEGLPKGVYIANGRKITIK